MMTIAFYVLQADVAAGKVPETVLRVHRWFHQYLDTMLGEAVSVSAGTIAVETRLMRTTVENALAYLIAEGFLVATERADGERLLRLRSNRVGDLYKLPQYRGSIIEDDPTLTAPKREPRNVSLRLRWQVLERDGHRCKGCGATAADSRLEVDHIHPHSRGGPCTEENLQTLCEDCNGGKGNLVPVSV
jgi:hypothetical protein